MIHYFGFYGSFFGDNGLSGWLLWMGIVGRYFWVIFFHLLRFNLMVMEGNYWDFETDGLFGIFPDFSIFYLIFYAFSLDRKLKLFLDKN